MRDLPERVRRAVGKALEDVHADAHVRVEIVAEIEREAGAAAKLRLVRSEI